ncbi:MAG: DUF2786 domain-containing protein [Succinivibrio sp.]
MNKDDLIVRVKKLLALSESSNANEAAIALVRAQKLIEKYQLDMTDIECADIGEIRIELPYGFKNKDQSFSVCQIIKKVFGVSPLISVSGSSVECVIFIGPKDILESCEYVFHILIRSMSTARREYSDRVDLQMLFIIIENSELFMIFTDHDPVCRAMLEQFSEQYTRTDSAPSTYRMAKDLISMLKVVKPQTVRLLNKLKKDLLKSFTLGYWHAVSSKVEEFVNSQKISTAIENYSKSRYKNQRSTGKRATRISPDAYESGLKEGEKVTLRAGVKGRAASSISYKH